jgi:pimeloyl-ACP methyl ester carboxylesterase
MKPYVTLGFDRREDMEAEAPILLDWQRVDVMGCPAAYGVGGDGPPLVFLHGWGLCGRTYRAALKRLIASGMRVYAPTLPALEAGGLSAYATWVDAFCDAVGISEPVVIVGHSFGGAVSVQTAHDFGPRVRGLVLVNAVGGAAPPQPFWSWGWRLPRELLPLRGAQRVIPLVLDSAISNLLRHPRAAWHAADVARDTDLSGELAVLDARGVPVVVIWSSDDALITRESFDSMCSALSEAVALTVPGNHAWLLADPEGFGRVMTNVMGFLPAA